MMKRPATRDVDTDISSSYRPLKRGMNALPSSEQGVLPGEGLKGSCPGDDVEEDHCNIVVIDGTYKLTCL